jgi:hypothetical protein
MSPHLNTNFNETPDVVPPIPPGTYTMEIMGAPKVEPSKKGDSTNVVMEMRIVDCPEVVVNGRSVIHYINLGKNPDMKLRADVMLKNLCKSAGVEAGAGGVDTEDLAGKRVKVVLASRSYKDPTSGEQRDGVEVKSYLA